MLSKTLDTPLMLARLITESRFLVSSILCGRTVTSYVRSTQERKSGPSTLVSQSLERCQSLAKFDCATRSRRFEEGRGVSRVGALTVNAVAERDWPPCSVGALAAGASLG